MNIFESLLKKLRTKGESKGSPMEDGSAPLAPNTIQYLNKGKVKASMNFMPGTKTGL